MNLYQLPVYYTVDETTKLFRNVKNVPTLLTLWRQISTNLEREFSAHSTQFCFFVHEGRDTMAARFAQSVFATLTVSRDDEKQFTAWVSKEKPTTEGIMSHLLGEGFKISISWVVDNNAFCLSIIGTDNTRQHKNMVMTTWSDDLAEVILLAGYKHFVICGGGEWPSSGTTERWG